MKFLDIKERQYVSMATFQRCVAVLQAAAGGAGVVRLHYYPLADLAVCDLGSVQIVGCTPELLPSELREVSTLIFVEGLDELAAAVRARGEEVLQGPEPCEAGRRLIVRHANSRPIEYVETLPPVPQAARKAQ